MNFQTYVLSLPNEIKRRKNISEQLNTIGIPFSFIDAVDMRKKSQQECEKKYTFSSQSTIKRLLTNGEIGCSLSHMQIYEKITQSDKNWHLILEDDALLDRLKISEIDEIINNSIDAEIIILGYSKLARTDERAFYIKEPIYKEIFSRNHYIGIPWKNWTCGTVAYLINKKGASKILNDFYCKEGLIQTVADDMLYFSRVCNVHIFHIRPLIVFENFQLFTSSIEKDRAKLSLPKKNNLFIEFIRYIRGGIRRISMLVKKPYN